MIPSDCWDRLNFFRFKFTWNSFLLDFYEAKHFQQLTVRLCRGFTQLGNAWGNHPEINVRLGSNFKRTPTEIFPCCMENVVNIKGWWTRVTFGVAHAFRSCRKRVSVLAKISFRKAHLQPIIRGSLITQSVCSRSWIFFFETKWNAS